MIPQRDPLVRSPHADAIYHADLFLIEGRVWMIGGTGKTRAGCLASGGERAGSLGGDSVAILRQGDALHGRYDPGALPVDPIERRNRHPAYPLAAIAYCLSEMETMQAYTDRPMAIACVDNKMLGWMLANAIYPAELAPFYFDRARLSRLFNRALRVTRFLELTEGAAGTQFVVVPWMPTVEARAALYAGYV